VGRKELYKDRNELCKILSHTEVIINVAGKSVVGKRWSNRVRREILQSRVEPAMKLMNCLEEQDVKPSLYISASAVGCYRSGASHDEFSMNFEKGFLTEVIEKWEKQAFEFEKLGMRVAVFRLGVVLGNSGGALKSLLRIFRWGGGAILGRGTEIMPFIGMQDIIGATRYIMLHEECKGIYNLVSPMQLTNHDFAIALGKFVRRPVLFRIPVTVLKGLLGEGATVLLENKIVIPHRLLKEGFSFQENYISDILTNKSVLEPLK